MMARAAQPPDEAPVPKHPRPPPTVVVTALQCDHASGEGWREGGSVAPAAARARCSGQLPQCAPRSSDCVPPPALPSAPPPCATHTGHGSSEGEGSPTPSPTAAAAVVCAPARQPPHAPAAAAAPRLVTPVVLGRTTAAAGQLPPPSQPPPPRRQHPLVSHLVMPLALPLLAAWWLLAFAVAVAATLTIVPSALLARRLYWACPFLPPIWARLRRQYGWAAAAYLRISFEGAYCMNVLTRLATLPLRRRLPDFYILGFPVGGEAGGQLPASLSVDAPLALPRTLIHRRGAPPPPFRCPAEVWDHLPGPLP